MIIIKQIAFGNSSEAYIQSGFTNGLNIISSSENHVGKTLIMQAMMYMHLVLSQCFLRAFLLRIMFF